MSCVLRENSFSKKGYLKKNFCQLIKIYNETMDSSMSVKAEAAGAPFLSDSE